MGGNLEGEGVRKRGKGVSEEMIRVGEERENGGFIINFLYLKNNFSSNIKGNE